MLKNLSLAIGYLVFVVLPTMASAADRCDVKWIPGTFSATVTVQDRRIDILGWSHIGDEEISTARNTILRALPFARASDCEKVQTTLLAGLKDLQEYLGRAKHMAAVLAELHAQNPLSGVAVELSPSELTQSLENRKMSQEKLGLLAAACGGRISEQIKSLRFLLDGPEYSFVQSQRELELLAIENDGAKAANGKDFEQILPFNEDDPRIDDFSRSALKTLSMNVFNYLPSEDYLYEAAVRFSPDSAEREKLKSDLKDSMAIWERRMAGAKERNLWMAKNLLTSKGNVVFPVGYNHAKDLVKQIVAACK